MRVPVPFSKDTFAAAALVLDGDLACDAAALVLDGDLDCDAIDNLNPDGDLACDAAALVLDGDLACDAAALVLDGDLDDLCATTVACCTGGFFVRKRSRILEISPVLFAFNNACTTFLDDGRDAAADASSGSAGDDDDDDNAIIFGGMNVDRDDRDDLRVATEPDRCDDLEPDDVFDPDDACGAAAATG